MDDPDGLERVNREGQDSHAALERELERVFSEESPRLASPAQAHHLARLYSAAESKRRGRRIPSWGWLAPVPRWLQIAAVAIVVVLVMNGVSVAAADSLPGSPLYSFKRLTEQGNVLLSPSAGMRARLWMELAGRRLDEAQLLLRTQGRVDNATLDAIDESILRALTEIASTRGAERVALLRSLTELAAREQGILEQLAGQVQDPDNRARLEQSARWLEGVGALAGSAPVMPQAPTPTSTSTPTQSDGPEITRMPGHLVSPAAGRPEATEQTPIKGAPGVSTEQGEENATPTIKPVRPTVPKATGAPEPTENPTEGPTSVSGGEDSTPSPKQTEDQGTNGIQSPAPARSPTEEN